MLLYIYLGLILFLLVCIIKHLFTEKNLFNQIDAALVIIPLILRLFLIK